MRMPQKMPVKGKAPMAPMKKPMAKPAPTLSPGPQVASTTNKMPAKGAPMPAKSPQKMRGY